jgi:hypothetical protein
MVRLVDGIFHVIAVRNKAIPTQADQVTTINALPIFQWARLLIYLNAMLTMLMNFKLLMTFDPIFA